MTTENLIVEKKVGNTTINNSYLAVATLNSTFELVTFIT